MNHEERIAAVLREYEMLSLSRQTELLDISRSSLYYRAKDNQEDKKLMDMIDAIATDYPFYGSRRIKNELVDRHGIFICREHIQRLMRMMGLEAIYPKPRKDTSIPDAAHKNNSLLPYLLSGITASRPNHIWGTDITYIRLEEGWVYLVALIDWYSRYVVSWEVSLSMETEFCIRTLKPCA